MLKAKKKFNSLTNFMKMYYRNRPSAIRIFEKSEEDILTTKVIPFQKPIAHIVAKSPAVIQHIFFKNPSNYGIEFRFKLLREKFMGKIKDIPTSLKTWEQDRSIITLFLSKEEIKKYFNLSATSTAESLDYLNQFVGTHHAVNLEKYIRNLFMKNVLNTIYGGVELDTEYVSLLLDKISSLPLPSILFHPILRPFLSLINFKSKNIQKNMENIGLDIIKQSFTDKITQSSIIKNLAKAYDFDEFSQLDTEMKRRFLNTATTFLQAADPTSQLLLSIIKLISIYPLVAEELYEEIKNILGSRVPDYDDLEKLVYTRALIQEVLRLEPSVLQIIRNCLDDDEIDGYAIRKNDLIFIPLGIINKLSKYWDNPESFDPRRFLNLLTKEQKLMYMPFGYGANSCIGAQFAMTQATLVLAMLIQRYRFALMPGFFQKNKNLMVYFTRHV